MRNAFIGLIIGIVAGIVLGTTVIAPRLGEIAAVGTQRADGGASGDAATQPTPPQETEATADDEIAEAEAGADAQVIRLRMASAFGPRLAQHGTLATRLERTLWRISGATLELRFHAPGTLVAADDALSAVISGAVDAYFTDVDELIPRDPAFLPFAGPPFGAPIAGYLGWIERGGGRELFQERLGELGLAGMICGLAPEAGGGWFRRPLAAAQDLVGLRIRAVGIEAALYDRLGAEVSGLPVAETLTGLDAGTLDAAQISTPHVDAALGLAERAGVYYLPGWRVPAKVFVLMMPLTVWDGLDTVARSRLRTACGDSIRHALAESEAVQFEALKTMTAAGIDVQPWPTEIDNAVRAAWQAEMAERRKADRALSRVLKSYAEFAKGQAIWDELARP